MHLFRKYLLLPIMMMGLALIAKGQVVNNEVQFVDTLSFWDSLSTQLIFNGKPDSSRAVLLDVIPLAIRKRQMEKLPFFFFKLGYIREQKGQDPAVEYLEGLRLAEQYKSEEWLGSLYQKVAYVEKYRGNSSLAVDYAQKAVDFTTRIKGSPTASSLVNLAWFLHEDDRPEEVCVDVLQSGISYYENDPASLQLIYHGFSEFYLFKVEDVHKALHYLELTLSVKDDGQRSKALANKAKALGMLERWDEAITFHQKAMESYFSNYVSLGDHSIPDFENSEGFVQHWYPQQLAAILLDRGIEYERSTDLEHVIFAVDRSNEMLDQFRMKLSRSEKNAFSGYQRRNSELGMTACYHLWVSTGDAIYLQKMLDYMERGRSTILLEKRIWEDLFQHNANIALEQSLTQEIEEMLLRIRTAPAGQKDSLVSISSEANRKLEKIKMEIEVESPLYFQGRYPSTIAMEKLATSLDTDQAMVNFFGTESGLFTLVISKDTSLVIKTDASQVDSMIADLRADIQSKSMDYVKKACELHSILIQPVLEVIEQRKWIVVKDYEQTLLPFEILVPCRANENLGTTSPQMQFASSATLFFKADPIDPLKEMLAFAPDFDTAGISLHVNTSIGEELSGAFAELQMVRTFFDGDFKVGKEATKEFFMEHAGNYKYIHLATHAVIDQKAPDASHLVFTPNGRGQEHNRLEAHELYTMQIPALLVTLSACNTGVGKMEPGEGAASLAKAFIYAGAENVLMSLWPVDDVITAELMRHFYRFFDKTRNPSYALSQAKREFVATHPGVLKHPYYWSGFVLISSRWNQVVARVSYLWLLPFLCTLLLGGFIYWRVRLK